MKSPMTMTRALILAFLSFTLSYCKDSAALHPDLASYSEPTEGVLPFFQGVKMDPFWPKTKDLPTDLRRMNDSIFRSDRGPAAKGSTIARGKYSLVTFFYTSCSGICPMITRNMKSLSARIQDQTDLQFVSISIDPDVDDENALRGYRLRQSVLQENWMFLTGSKKEIEELARQQFAGEVEASTGKDGLKAFVHTENVFLLDRDGYLRGIYRMRGQGEFPRLLKDLQTLREERPLTSR